MNAEELQNRIESSPGLRRVKTDLVDEIAFRADDSTRFDPMTILMIISIIIQVISYCRKRNTDEAIIDAIRNAKTLPRRKTILLRRRLGELDCFAAGGPVASQPAYAALMDMSENMTDEEIQEMLQLAREYKD